MANLPRITIDIDGMAELQDLISMAEQQAQELRATVRKISNVRLEIQAKINQPPAATNG